MKSSLFHEKNVITGFRDHTTDVFMRFYFSYPREREMLVQLASLWIICRNLDEFD